MATASSGQGGGGGDISSGCDRDGNLLKKHPLNHDQLQQKCPPDPNNVFSIDRTFSATSTDIQPSFDVFDDNEDEDDSNSSGRGYISKRKVSDRNTKSGADTSYAHHNIPSSTSRADAYRKEMAFHRLHRRHDVENESKSKPKHGNNSYYNAAKTGAGNFNGNNITSKRDMKAVGGYEMVERSNKGYYVETEDSIGVPSDISGMLQDSEVVDEEDGEKRDAGSNKDFGLNNNGFNGTSKVDVKDNSKTEDIDRYRNKSYGKSCAGESAAARREEDGATGTGGSSRRDGFRKGNNGALKSSIISDGRFGSVNSISSSFNSAAAAAISSSYGGAGSSSDSKFGGGIHATGGPAGGNDVLNERLERFHRYTRGPYAPLDRCNSTSVSSAHSSTITQHYYPEGGWGYVVLAVATICHALMYGFQLSAGVFLLQILSRFGEDLVMNAGTDSLDVN